MKKLLPKLTIIMLTTLTINVSVAQLANKVQPPNQVYGALFTAVQNSTVFADSKTFVDCVPKRNPEAIVADYNKSLLGTKPSTDKLQAFVQKNFEVPGQLPSTQFDNENDVVAHINSLWKTLQRSADKRIAGISLLALPKPYIVPGGRFREIYYWDSYFTMLGLKESGEIATIQNMVDNFAYLINTYGHVPNGNRTYYLSRSQPPFFSLMVELLASIKGNEVYKKYLPQLQQEYNYWMEGAYNLRRGTAYKRVVKLPNGTILNRYYDDLDIPRQEGYKEDVKTAELAASEAMATMRFASAASAKAFSEALQKKIYRNLRAGACSGWDYSSRWFANPDKISTIQVLDIAPVDLNCLILHLEKTIAKANGRSTSSRALNRQAAIYKYFWHGKPSYFYDYNFVQKASTGVVSAAGLYPFYFIQFGPEATITMGKQAADIVEKELLKSGGLQSTNNANGQQWDSPNGWAPQQWMAIKALENCKQPELAKTIAIRWVTLNKKVFANTGKLMEKYNVVDDTLDAGGGEYPGQDGFGWTNGVLLALIKKYGL